MSELSPTFLVVDFPAVFDLEVPFDESPTGWITDVGGLRPEDFDRLEDGSYLCAGYGGRPLYMRVVERQPDGVIKCADGGGGLFLWRIKAATV